MDRPHPDSHHHRADRRWRVAGTGRVFGKQHRLLSLIAYLVAAVVYLIAWIVALFDSIQERRWGWLIALIILSPVLIGPLLYSVIGPKNTK